MCSNSQSYYQSTVSNPTDPYLSATYLERQLYSFAYFIAEKYGPNNYGVQIYFTELRTRNTVLADELANNIGGRIYYGM